MCEHLLKQAHVRPYLKFPGHFGQYAYICSAASPLLKRLHNNILHAWFSEGSLLQGDGTETPGANPEEGPYWSLMFEVSESELKPVNNDSERFAGGTWAGVVRECVLGALATKLISSDDRIVSLYHRHALTPLRVQLSGNCIECSPLQLS